jgi:hypothetical protein
MAFEVSGKLVEIFDTVQASASFRKREFVIETKESVGSSEYTNYIKFQLTQDRCNLIDSFNLNDLVKVSFNIRGNRWEKDGKVSFFTNLAAWRIDKEAGSTDPDIDVPFPDVNDMPPTPEDSPDDDLPF